MARAACDTPERYLEVTISLAYIESLLLNSMELVNEIEHNHTIATKSRVHQGYMQ